MKDKNSVVIANFSRRNAPWNPGFEVAIIKATSHDETKLDYKNTKRVFAWLHASPAYLKLLLCALSIRLQKTRSWVVALKGLMLMHGVLRCNISGVQRIGRLPFDLSYFGDGCRRSGRNSGLNSFVQSYFEFLDQRSAFLCMEQNEERKETDTTRTGELVKLQQQQTLLDILLQIKPQAMEIDAGLVYEAMDCVIIEIFSFYNGICSEVSRVLTRIHAAEKVEAAMALEILRKASKQSEKLVLYLEFCREIGIFNAAKFPEVEKIPKRDIQRLERIVSARENKTMLAKRIEPKEKQEERDGVLQTIITEKEGAQWVLRTIITEKWEVFDEEQDFINGIAFFSSTPWKTTVEQNPTTTPTKFLPTMHEHKYEMPDLITF